MFVRACQMAVSSIKGCVSVGLEGNSYSQNAELRWDNKSVKQSMKYQVPHEKNLFVSITLPSLRAAADGLCFEGNLFCDSALFIEGSTGNA